MIITVCACCVVLINNLHMLEERIKDIDIIRSIRIAMFGRQLSSDLEFPRNELG